MNEYRPGDLIVLRTHEREGQSGVVNKPIHADADGQALVFDNGAVVGVDVGVADLEMAGDNVEGWAQLAHTLIELGSHIIEQRLLLYRN